MQDQSLIEIDEQLYEYIQKHGGVLSIGEYYIIQGCCRAEKLPSGRMASPKDMIPKEDEDQYRSVQYGDVRIYIQKQLIEENRGYKFAFWFAPLGESWIQIR